MSKHETQEIELVVQDAGDPSVGIPDFFEEVKITLKYGGHRPETIKKLQEQLAEFLANFFCECQGKCFTKSQYEAETAALIRQTEQEYNSLLDDVL